MDDDCCERPGCTLPAAWVRWKADPDGRGINHSEPGMKPERLCHAHANEVRMYVGGPMERLPESTTGR